MAFQNVEYIEQEGWKPQMTCMPGVNTVWQWDSCLMVFITNYANGTISALNNLDNLYRLRREHDGYMSMAYRISTEQPAWPGRINPPLMAWAEWEAYRISGDVSRFEQALPALEGNYGFIEQNRKLSCGLYWFEDPGSSGMDNAPRGPYGAGKEDGSGICYVDLACQQALSAKCMAQMFAVLGNTERADFYRAEQDRINDLINHYRWSEKAGWYFDFFARGTAAKKVKLINSKTAAAFWAILCAAATGQRLQRMLQHMFDPAEFYGKVPFASLSADDLNFDPAGGYWLGGVWAPTNYSAIRGMTEAGQGTLAREAAVRYLDAVCHVANDPAYGNTIWECYSPTAYRPSTAEEGELVRADFVGWSGLAPITMLIETIMGLHFNADNDWIHMDQIVEEGFKTADLGLNGEKVKAEDSVASVKVVAPAEAAGIFTLNVENGYNKPLKHRGTLSAWFYFGDQAPDASISVAESGGNMSAGNLAFTFGEAENGWYFGTADLSKILYAEDVNRAYITKITVSVPQDYVVYIDGMNYADIQETADMDLINLPHDNGVMNIDMVFGEDSAQSLFVDASAKAINVSFTPAEAMDMSSGTMEGWFYFGGSAPAAVRYAVYSGSKNTGYIYVSFDETDVDGWYRGTVSASDVPANKQEALAAATKIVIQIPKGS